MIGPCSSSVLALDILHVVESNHNAGGHIVVPDLLCKRLGILRSGQSLADQYDASFTMAYIQAVKRRIGRYFLNAQAQVFSKIEQSVRYS